MKRLARLICNPVALSSLTLLSALVLAACSADYSASTMSEVRGRERAAATDMAKVSNQANSIQAMESAPSPNGATSGVAGLATMAALSAMQPDRHLIKNAILVVEVNDARVASDKLVAACQTLGGYVSALNEQTNSLGRRSVEIQLRAPSTSFDQALLQFEAVGKSITRSVNTEDVTEQYVDTESKTRNLKKTEERLLDHLTRSGELEDVLRVESELNRVREQIESFEGRIRFLSDRISYSTFNVTLTEVAKAEALVPPHTFSTANVFSSAVRSLVSVLQAVWVIVIWMAVWSPVWLLFIGLILYLRRLASKYDKEATKEAH